MRLATSLFVGVLLLSSSAAAQVITRPERPITGVFGAGRPPDPTRARQDLILTLSTLGGYDDHLSPRNEGADAFAEREPGYTGVANADLNYRRRHDVRLFELGTRGFMNTYRNAGLKPAYGGDAHAQFVSPLGRRSQLELSQDVRNQPFYALAPYTALRQDVGLSLLPDTNSANGFSIRRSWQTDTSAAFLGRWRSGSSLRGSYGYQRNDFRDDIGDGYSHRMSLDYNAATGRRSSIRLSYRHSQSEYLEFDSRIRPLTDHTAELGFQHEHELSRTRRWLIAFGAGATYADTVNGATHQPLQYTTPSGHANTRLDVGRTWSIWADYRRGVTVLQGLTAESFVTEAGMVRVGGFIGSRSEIAVSAAYSEGAQSFGRSPGRFDSYTGTIQLRQLLTRTWSVVVSDNFYRHTLHDIANLPPTFPARLDRNAVQIGMTLELPLYGAYVRQRGRAGAGT